MAIVKFEARTQPKPDVWQCRCGSYTFWLYSTGVVYCSDCRKEAVTMNGYWQIPERSGNPTQPTADIIPLEQNMKESAVHRSLLNADKPTAPKSA